MSAFVIDSFAYCRNGEHREGDIPVAGLQRLTEDTADDAGTLHWVLQGGSDQMGHSRLDLSVAGKVHLTCQRCLTPFEFAIDSHSSLILAKDEEQIEGIDALLEDDSVDVIVGSAVFNVVELIEDEALLALPLAPKHDVCPDAATLEALKGASKPSPFAGLKNLKS
jgi:uncharacterized protein